MDFSKYAGSGNDFILIDNRALPFPANPPLIARLCHRQLGIGADGVILLENSQKADFRMRIFNADGGEAEMCGNGIRCLMRFIRELGGIRPTYKIETMHSLVTIAEEGEGVCVQMPEPFDIQWDMTLNNIPHRIQRLNTGVPHAVLFVDDLEAETWMALAPHIRRHPSLAPEGTNVNFASLDPSGSLRVRTYERGVEGETLACGTGATASALAAAKCCGLKSPIRVLPRSEEPLLISFTWEGETPTQVAMTGPAHFIFRGEISV